MKFVATVTGCVQVGENEYKTVKDSRVFDYNQPFQEVIDWARRYIKIEPVINFIEISHLHE